MRIAKPLRWILYILGGLLYWATDVKAWPGTEPVGKHILCTLLSGHRLLRPQRAGWGGGTFEKGGPTVLAVS